MFEIGNKVRVKKVRNTPSSRWLGETGVLVSRTSKGFLEKYPDTWRMKPDHIICGENYSEIFFEDELEVIERSVT